MFDSVAAFLLLTAVLGLAVWGASWATVRALKFRQWLMVWHIVCGILPLRRVNCLDRGLRRKRLSLPRQVFVEARNFCARIQPLGGAVGWTSAETQLQAP